MSDRAVKVIIAQLLVLGGDASGTVIQVTDAQVLAAQRHHGRGAKAKALGAQYRRLDHVESGFHAAVGLQANETAQSVATQCLLDLGQAQLPG